MRKEKTIRTYQRRTKSGKTDTVRSHKATYDAADLDVGVAVKKHGAGSEFENRKKNLT